MEQISSLVCNSRLSIINLYREQLRVFKKLGIGQRTEHGTIVTDKLIDTTKRRLSQLSTTYEVSLTPAAERWRFRVNSPLKDGLINLLDTE